MNASMERGSAGHWAEPPVGAASSSPSQTEQILDALLAGRELSPLDALMEMNCLRLAARIHDLKAAGYPVVTSSRTVNGKTLAVYTLPVAQMGLAL